jgi:hypothetical protein
MHKFRNFQRQRHTSIIPSHNKVVNNFENFPESINTPSYDQRFTSYDRCKLGVLLKFISVQNKIPVQIWNLSLLSMEKWKNLEYRVINHFITFLTKGRTYKIRFLIRIDFKILSVITLIGLNCFQCSSYLCICICEIMTLCRSYMFLTKRKLLPNIDDVRIVGGKSLSSP